MRGMKLFDVLGVVMALAVGFGADAATSIMRGWVPLQMTVQVSNETGQPVSQLAIMTRNGSRTVTTLLEPLAVGGELGTRVPIAGEGLYQLEATLADGRVLKGSPAYVQSGYSARERLRPDGVSSQVNFGW